MANRTFSLVPRGSFSWSRAFSVLTRFLPLAHTWRGDEHDVVLSLVADGDFAPVDVRLRFDAGALHGEVSDAARTEIAARQVARVFSLDHDGAAFDDLLAREERLASVAAALPGLRPVCSSSPYEAACWAIVSQRISMRQAAGVFATLVEQSGGRFPAPDRLMRLERVRGLAPVKIDRLRAVAAAAIGGGLDAERLRALGDVEGPESLRRIPGIGPFWSSGIYLRACGIADVFPDEPRSIAALEKLYGDRDGDRFRPFRMWACFLLRVADARGLIVRRPPRSGRTSAMPGGAPPFARSSDEPSAPQAITRKQNERDAGRPHGVTSQGGRITA